jgi:hypothetical protein
MKTRMFTHATAVAALLGAALGQACSDSGSDVSAPDDAPILRVTTSLSGDVAARIPEFANLAGAVNNKAEPGRHEATGRREINWDGVPAQFNNTDAFPANFFNVNSTRGLEYVAAAGTGLRVSDQNFADINPTYATELSPLSTPRLFSPIGSNRSEIRFRIPGTDTAAAVQTFGAVFVDVDKANTSRLQAFDKDARLIADVPVPVRQAADPFSFVGVRFDRAAIARVVLILGDTRIGAGINDVSSGGQADVVVLDDFIYGEPQPIH